MNQAVSAGSTLLLLPFLKIVTASPATNPKDTKIAIAIYEKTHDRVAIRKAISLAMKSTKNKMLRIYGLSYVILPETY